MTGVDQNTNTCLQTTRPRGYVSGGQPVSPEPLSVLVNKCGVDVHSRGQGTSQDSGAVVLKWRSVPKLTTVFATNFGTLFLS